MLESTLMLSSIIWQDVVMMFGQSILLETVILGVLNPQLQDHPIIPIALWILIVLKQVKDQQMNFHQFLTVLLISIVNEDFLLGTILSNLTMDGS